MLTFVNALPGEPPVAGYSYRNGSSWLDFSGIKAATSDDPIEDSMKHIKVSKVRFYKNL